MDILIKAKHWQIFGTLISVTLIQKLLLFGSIHGGIGAIGLVFYTFQIVITLSWVLLLGSILHKQNKGIQKVRYQIFIVTGITLMVVVCGLAFLITPERITNHSALVILLTIYYLISLFIVFSFPVRTLKSIETNDDVDINDYFGDIFLLLFWPIGIWFIQPRLNKLAQRKVNSRQQ